MAVRDATGRITHLIQCNARPALNAVMLGELIDLISGIALGEDLDRTRDVLGRVYEYEAATPLYNRITGTERESRTLTQTRDLLLQKLMSGEIRVREAQRTVAEVL